MFNLLVVVIDFGIIYFGYVFFFYDEFKRDLIKSFLKNWVDFISLMMYCKILICVLFNKEKELDKFGFEVEVKYLDLMFENDYDDWYFFGRFKMVLYEF